MCKIMLISGIKKENVSKVIEFAKVIAPKLSVHNDDGFGYAAMDSNGKVFGERWLENRNALTGSHSLNSFDTKLIKLLGPDAFKEKIKDGYSSFGKKNYNDIIALMLHARSATNEKSIENTHPFVIKDTALIHNGVIRNHEQLTKTMSTCDSEVILHEYLKYSVAKHADQIHEVISSIRGYYACGVLTKDENNQPILDLFKSKQATLYATFVTELDSVVFCTSKTDLENALSQLNWTINKILEFEGDQFVRFNALTGEKLAHFKIESNEIYNPHYITPYSRDKDELNKVIDKYKDDVDWVKLIEDEEINRSLNVHTSMM